MLLAIPNYVGCLVSTATQHAGAHSGRTIPLALAVPSALSCKAALTRSGIVPQYKFSCFSHMRNAESRAGQAACHAGHASSTDGQFHDAAARPALPPHPHCIWSAAPGNACDRGPEGQNPQSTCTPQGPYPAALMPPCNHVEAATRHPPNNFYIYMCIYFFPVSNFSPLLMSSPI